ADGIVAVMQRQIDAVVAVEVLEIGERVRHAEVHMLLARRRRALGEDRTEGALHALVRSGLFVEFVRHQSDRRRNRKEQLRLQRLLQRVGELLEILRTAEVRRVAGVLQLNAVATIEIVEEVREICAVLDRDLRGGGERKQKRERENKTASHSGAIISLEM